MWMTEMPFLMMKCGMPISLSPTLMGLLAIRLSPQAGKSLVISRNREREQTYRYAN
jgi:hypothetical protein